MNAILKNTSISLALSVGLTACSGGGGGSSSSGGGPLAGYKVPTEISAVPARNTPAASGLRSMLLALGAATDAGTDYSEAKTTKFVEEHSLEQFATVESVMKALAQTHYSEAANLNQGPYKAMVSQVGNNNGTEQKQLEPWVVDSAMIVENGQNVNRVRVWIEEVDNGTPKVVKAEFKIYASATQNADGTYQDYGVWTLNAALGGTDYFVASASIGASGQAIVKVHENHSEMGMTFSRKGILNKSAASGVGKVEYPDFSACTSPPCTPVTTTAKYVYDASHLGLQVGADPAQYKDRASITDITRRYGMYDSVTGQDVMKAKSFGFPVRYTDSNGLTRFAYYGAWQGRHQLWANGDTVAPGTVVTRQDIAPGQPAQTYTVSQPFVGTLVKRTMVAADIGDILNIPVETWVNANLQLQYLAAGPSGAGWYQCQFVPMSPPSCTTLFGDFASLVIGANDTRKFVNIGRWDSVNNVPIHYVYLASGPSGAGFYLGNFDQSTGRTTATSTLYTPADADNLWVNIGGSIYIMYTGVTTAAPNGWVQKTLLSFDQGTWTPTFDPAGDIAYTPDLNREYYISNQGINYIVKMTSSNVYEVKIELQSVANPVNISAFLAAGTYFKPQWDSGTGVSYDFVTDSASPNFLKLVYRTVGGQQGVNVGDVVTTGQWGLMAYDASDVATGTQFNWDYPSQGQSWGTVTYLIDTNSAYKLLDDPIRLAPITLANNASQPKTLTLQFDGWMGGLPDLYQELQKNAFVMTADIAAKVINIPAGTVVTDAADSSKSYLIKPLEVSQFLNTVADPGTLDIAAADATDLSTVPAFVDPLLGAVPATTGIKYSEGKLIE